MPEAIVDHIYEAAFVPDFWEDVLEQTGEMSRSVSGVVFVHSDGKPLCGRTVKPMKPFLNEFLSGDMWKLCDSANRMLDVQPASFVRIEDFLTPEEIERDPVRVRLRAMGIGTGLCTTIQMPSGDIVSFVYSRATAAGLYDEAEIGRLNRLRPHLARASLMAARLGLERAQSTVAVMEQLGLPAAVLTARGRVLAANALLASLPHVFIARAHGALALAPSEADALLQTALAELSGNAHAAVRSIPIARDELRPAMVVHALPLRRTARDILVGGDVLIVALEVRPGEKGPPVSVLAGLFDLTPAEARLAAALTAGLTLQQAAVRQGITVKTARSYLEHIFRKTGTGQQSQLVALLAGARLLQPK